MLAPVAPARSHRRSCIGDVHTTHSTTVPTVTPTMLSSSAKSFCTPKRLHHVKLKGLPKINTTCCADAVKTHKFNASIKNFGPARLEETAQSRWNQLTSFIHQPPVDAFGRRERQTLTGVMLTWKSLNLQQQRQAFMRWKQDPNVKNLNALRRTRAESHRTARKCANDYWI